jgi:uncharacterized membrane protein YgaE (UPF0421/DUF939 family)
MKLVIVFVALAAMLGTAKLWASKMNGAWESTTVIIGVGLALLVVLGMVGVWLRDRQRQRLTDLRDSALW